MFTFRANDSQRKVKPTIIPTLIGTLCNIDFNKSLKELVSVIFPVEAEFPIRLRSTTAESITRLRKGRERSVPCTFKFIPYKFAKSRNVPV